MQLREDDSISTLDIPPISVFQPILIDDFYQDNLKKHLDESPILGKNYRGEDLGDKDKVLLQFIRLCKALKNKSIESTDAEKKNLQKTFAYILDNVEGDSETKIERKRMFLCFNLLALKPDLVTQLDDITFILNHVGQKNRAWLKTCIIQTLRNRVKELHKEEEQLELQGIVGELQNTLDNLQETISDLQKRPVKAKSVEKALKERLAELNEQIKQLEALEAQLGITKSAGLRVNLEEFHTQLKGYSDAIESDPTDNYENLQSKFNFAGIKRKLNEHKKNGIHDSLLDAAYIASEIANVGLVLQEVVGAAFGERWIEMGMAVGEYSNPIIYGFKAIQRGMKLIGRKYFGLEFADDEVGINPRQNLWDTISATIFIAVTVLLSVGAALAFPLLETAAWLIAPAGLAVVWKSEYGYQNERARDRLENMKTSEGLFDEQDQVEADRIAWHKKVASFALAGVIIFITLGMLASSIVGLPILDQIPNLFTFITIVSGGALAFLALARAGNFLVERKGKEFVKGIKEFVAHPIDGLIAAGRSLSKGFINLLGTIAKKGTDFVEGFKEFCRHPGASLKAAGTALYDGFTGFLGKAKTWFGEQGDKIKDYWNGLSTWQKAALAFSITALALSISVLSGGIAPLIGLIVAGVCSTISLALKGYNAYKNRLPSVEAEKMKPFGGDKECTAALTAIATTQKINLTESNEVDIDPQTISSPAAQTQKEVVALDLEEVVEQDHEEVVEQDHEENRFISSAPRL